jgi:hypothetical protein
MFVCNTHIELGSWLYEFVCEVKIKSTWKQLTDTCTITLPKKTVMVKNGTKAQSLVKVGDTALVKFGYDERIAERFKGYISAIKPGMPMEFQLEDEMFQLKRKEVKPKSFQSATVEGVLKYIGVEKYKIIGDGKIDIGGDFTLDGISNAAQALLKLKEALPIAMFFRGDTLYIGEVYKAANPNRVKLWFGHNIIDHSLEYKDKDDVKIKVEAISKQDDGKDVKVEVGDPDGERHTFHTAMNMKQADVKAFAEAHIDEFKWSGWRGTVTLFGEPIVAHGDIVELYDDTHEIEGNYYADEVETTNGTGGIRQIVTIGRKA